MKRVKKSKEPKEQEVKVAVEPRIEAPHVQVRCPRCGEFGHEPNTYCDAGRI